MRGWRTERCIALLSALLLTGCATTPPLRAAWYQTTSTKETSDGSDLQADPMRIAIVNDGDKPVTLHGVTLKAFRNDGNGADIDLFASSEAPLTLDPSKLLVFDLPESKLLLPCRVPTRLLIRAKAGRKPVPITMGGLPTYLSEDMIKCDTADHRLKHPRNSAAPPSGAVDPTTPPPSAAPQ